jgi:hypothetical protein
MHTFPIVREVSLSLGSLHTPSGVFIGASRLQEKFFEYTFNELLLNFNFLKLLDS